MTNKTHQNIDKDNQYEVPINQLSQVKMSITYYKQITIIIT